MSTQKRNVSQRVRAKMTAKGLTVPVWAEKNGFKRSSVYAAISGVRKGTTTEQVLAKLREDGLL